MTNTFFSGISNLTGTDAWMPQDAGQPKAYPVFNPAAGEAFATYTTPKATFEGTDALTEAFRKIK